MSRERWCVGDRVETTDDGDAYDVGTIVKVRDPLLVDVAWERAGETMTEDVRDLSLLEMAVRR